MRDLLAFTSLATVPAFGFAAHFAWRNIIPFQDVWTQGLCALAGVWTAAVAAAIIKGYFE